MTGKDNAKRSNPNVQDALSMSRVILFGGEFEFQYTPDSLSRRLHLPVQDERGRVVKLLLHTRKQATLALVAFAQTWIEKDGTDEIYDLISDLKRDYQVTVMPETAMSPETFVVNLDMEALSDDK